ncbi:MULTISPECIES: hypothetical protein [Streptomyces]|jgi:hypothetical protein|uniref:DUF1902 domain-containing protein n=2 Tax=Streptomyces TaxID=1883 RepID=A0ABT5G3K5_9ACTN|nr:MULTISPECIES: hypothetical protein [Streptomyces]MCL6672795.1 hypothetical protein [Streptomyces panaciradicis]NUP39314.1 hypothetical protein [Streptomyces sp.]ALV30853.1 hypothetical protein AS200_01170 [Streptomyces sp. CdTB01]MBK3641466.1 hypothetical protein [Streptomyces sp. MBT33]MDC2959389.1 hypothetical protein [Streptomyces gilvifuscus]
MNNLIYEARMALRDVMEVNIYSQGNDKVYLTVFPELVWEGTEKTQPEKVVRNVIGLLHDMDLDVADGEASVRTLLDSGPVEIVRKAA